MSILIIDDEQALRQILSAYLEDLGHSTLEAGDGREGLAVLENDAKSIEAVIVDLNMPVMDGYQFIEQAVLKAPETPVVVLSGIGSTEGALKAMRLGAWDFITKPMQSLEILQHILVNVLDRARLIKENRIHRENLESQVRQRTAELEQALLKAEAASEAKSAFLANMNHELRTPMNKIMGLLRLLQDTSMSQEQAYFVEESFRAADGLNTILGRMLQLTALESGQWKPRDCAFALRSALEPLERSIQERAQLKGLDFSWQVSTDLPECLFGSRDTLQHALICILYNAVHFTEQGRVALVMACEAGAFAAGAAPFLLHCTVSDTGPGIAPEMHERIFDPFEIGEHYLTKRACGAGMGLSVAKRLVESARGRIWFESVPGAGSTFHVELPMRKAATQDEST